jgi:hypothetical protein
LASSSATAFFERGGPLRVSFGVDDRLHVATMTVGGWGEPTTYTRR